MEKLFSVNKLIRKRKGEREEKTQRKEERKKS